MPGYIIYCRKSSEAEDRQILSIDSQIRELKALAARLNLPIVDVLTESMSAKAPGRPVFDRMMKRVEGQEVAGIICWKLDRLARNPVDGGSIIWAVKKYSASVITPSQWFRREDDNVILMYIEFGFAQKYVDDLSKNVKNGLKTKIEAGWRPGVAPPGYLNYRDPLTKHSTIIKDPERFELVRKMWDLMLTGSYTPTQILNLANYSWGYRTRQRRKLGGKLLSRSSIYLIFSDPFYYGRFEYPFESGQWHDGGHEPMITKAEFDRVQMLIRRTDSPRPQIHEFSFTGLIRCGGCRRLVTAEEKHQVICDVCRLKFAHSSHIACPRCQTEIAHMKAPRFLRYTYYHCSKSNEPRCPQKSISGGVLEKQILKFLSQIEISQKFKDWALKYVDEVHRTEIASRPDIASARRKAYDQTVQRINNLVALKTSPDNADGSLLSEVEYRDERAKLIKEKEHLELALKDSEQANLPLSGSKETFEFASELCAKFASADAKAKKLMLRTIGSNLILTDKILRIEAKKPFFIIGNSKPLVEGKTAPIEPEKKSEKQGPNAPTRRSCPSLLRGRNEDRTFGPIARQTVRAIYHYFQKRQSCLCDACQDAIRERTADLDRKGAHGENAPQSLNHTCFFRNQTNDSPQRGDEANTSL